jgi:hypothetical protein
VDRVAGLEGGADDYVVKPFSPKELLARIQAVLRRCSPEFVKGTLSVGPITLDTVSHEASVEGQRITLTPTEFRLLRFLMASPGRVYSRQQLLDTSGGIMSTSKTARSISTSGACASLSDPWRRGIWSKPCVARATSSARRVCRRFRLGDRIPVSGVRSQ